MHGVKNTAGTICPAIKSKLLLLPSMPTDELILANKKSTSDIQFIVAGNNPQLKKWQTCC